MQREKLLKASFATVSSVASLLSLSSHGKRDGSTNVRRQRVPVQVIFQRLGPRLFRKAYRMSEALFWKLHDLIFPPALSTSNERLRGSTPNGDIPFSTRLSIALRWFAGGEPIDILQVHGVSYQQVYISVWNVVDAINECESIQIAFPTEHSRQIEIAEGFKRKSRVDFPSCLGCVDGMLIWINKPCQKSKLQSGIGPKKFYCGRKKKFGINLQAICDHRRRFLDIDVRHPGSTSDYLSFSTSKIHSKILTVPNFLHPSLHFFGDNAYVNTSFMATPFKGSHSGVKDAYNFYHSQLRINIECAFGMLVHRWGVLRKPFPVNITVSKVSQIVRVLCILHNFCIDGNESLADDAFGSDTMSRIDAGAYLLAASPEVAPQHLNDPGHHADDYDFRRIRRAERNATDLPRDKMLQHLQAMGIHRRPAPFASTTTNSSSN